MTGLILTLTLSASVCTSAQLGAAARPWVSRLATAFLYAGSAPLIRG